MSHRTADDDRERPRRGQYSRLDQEAATRIMNREWRTAIPRRDVPSVIQHDADSTAVARLATELARDAVIPDALAVACAEHDAEPGAYCFRGARGVCRDRLDLRPRHA